MAKLMLPKQIDPFQLADNESTLKGELPLDEMDRLVEVLCDKPGKASIELKFGRDVSGYAYMIGHIYTGLWITCQRCSAPMRLDLTIDVEASPVYSDKEAKQLPKSYDPLFLAGDTVSLSAMVEEEILLSIPIVPRHSPDECQIKSSQLVEWEDEVKDEKNPFAVLKKLLRE